VCRNDEPHARLVLHRAVGHCAGRRELLNPAVPPVAQPVRHAGAAPTLAEGEIRLPVSAVEFFVETGAP
jgi:hypothetical protein